jgi:hypothetical protein
MRSSLMLSIPQPCHESWDAMTPTAAGRHCAACAKTVVDFTLKSDAEILALLAGAANGRTCGRFAAGQLGRPLQRAAPAAPTARWRAWLAAAVAVWGVREAVSGAANAQAPVEMQCKMGKPVISDQLRAVRKPDYEGATQVRVLRGIVRDSATHEGLPGISVLIRNSAMGVSTDHEGRFELTLPADYASESGIVLQVSFIGYRTEERHIPVGTETQPLEFMMRPDNRMLGELVVVGGIELKRPWPWHPRRFFYWTKYQLTRPFRR